MGLASLGVRFVRQRRLGSLPPGVWIADDDDQAAIGDPLARIAARHTPIGVDGPSDLVDGVEAMVATVGYAGKHLEYEAEVAEWRAAQLAEQEPTQ